LCTIPSIFSVVIHSKAVINLLSNLKEHKAKGPDEIPLNNTIKEVLLRNITYKFFNPQFKVPTEWKTVNIVPVFKKGERIMHLSILSPTTPLPGVPGGIVGDLIRFDLKNRPTGGAFDSS